MPNQTPSKPPLINCHTHIFTGDHVPPYLAKTFIPWPFYMLAHVTFLVRIFRWWYNGPGKWKYAPSYLQRQKKIYGVKMFVRRQRLLDILYNTAGFLVTVHVFFILVHWLSAVSAPGDSIGNNLTNVQEWLTDKNVLFIPVTVGGKIILILLVFLFFKTGRNLILFLLKKIWSFLGILPGKDTKALIQRYINIGRFAFYRSQDGIYKRLRDQYPDGTGFILLPMDMEYMDAGNLKPEFNYHRQMEELEEIKNHPKLNKQTFPFIFAEPRRMSAEGKEHFSYTIADGKVNLEPCFIKTYLEEHKFSGIKIYPALGYFPFDEVLLPLWKYAADQGLPILTHCIRGTIFYRGPKEKSWDNHPVFEQHKGNLQFEPLSLLESKNVDFSINFTHPLNYLCLLEERLLRKLVAQAKDDRIRELFGYNGPDSPLTHNLHHLKICFGHFGGEDQWNRFFELDRDNYSSSLVKYPDKGISFLESEAGDFRRGKLEQLWRVSDWYSQICSMMLQFPNIYADLSYIIHDTAIQPLLKHTLFHPRLREKVLFGTDFYVVRNHKTEKNMMANTLDHLDDKDFDTIARINPRAFLNSKLHGPVSI